MTEAQTLTLADFLLARIAEDDAAARSAIANTGVWEAMEDFGDGGSVTGSFVVDVSEKRPGKTAGNQIFRYDRYEGELLNTGEIVPPGPSGILEFSHVARWDPARVLAECDAKRRIIGEHVPDRADCAVCAGEESMDEDSDGNRSWYRSGKSWPCPTLKILAAPYADHPDYRPEWRP